MSTGLLDIRHILLTGIATLDGDIAFWKANNDRILTA
jgi:hypothetical protein